MCSNSCTHEISSSSLVHPHRIFHVFVDQARVHRPLVVKGSASLFC